LKSHFALLKRKSFMAQAIRKTMSKLFSDGKNMIALEDGSNGKDDISRVTTDRLTESSSAKRRDLSKTGSFETQRAKRHPHFLSFCAIQGNLLIRSRTNGVHSCPNVF
jgi:hypothetical protein